MNRAVAPDRTEASEYYFRYIDQVAPGDICEVLAAQGTEVLALSRGVTEERSQFRYQPGKWSLRQVLSHINDTERLFAMRAFWFARGHEAPLPSFDQDVAIAVAGADERSWASHVAEFEAVRAATRTLFENLPADAWSRRGTASGFPFSVKALAYITAGHVTHHLKIVREKYLQLP